MIETHDLIIYHQDNNGHRLVYHPGDPLDDAPPEVQQIAVDLWTEEAVAEWRATLQGEPTLPSPAYSLAWATLIVSPLYQRALAAAFVNLPVNTAMTTFGIAFQAHRDLPHEVWAGALSAAAGHLAMAINGTDTPLTLEEQQWVDAWNTTHHLGLTTEWENNNG
jgi:hypothetical protein